MHAYSHNRKYLGSRIFVILYRKKAQVVNACLLLYEEAIAVQDYATDIYLIQLHSPRICCSCDKFLLSPPCRPRMYYLLVIYVSQAREAVKLYRDNPISTEQHL